MSLIYLLEITILSLARHFFRSFLAMLGVVLGVGAVVAMLAVSEGARRESLAGISAMGVQNIVVHAKEPTSNGESEKGNEAASSYYEAKYYGPGKKDLEHLHVAFEGIESIVPFAEINVSPQCEGRVYDYTVIATTAGFPDIGALSLDDARGRWFLPDDGDQIRPVCVLGRNVARTIFGLDDPMGKIIHLGDVGYEIIGIVRSGRTLGNYQLDTLIYVPFETRETLLASINRSDRKSNVWGGSFPELSQIIIKAESPEAVPALAARLRGYLGKSHPKQDYRIQVPYELLKQKERTQKISQIVMGAIAAISLLVGGIGIMNIMLANIYERTREIGTRRALGAQKIDILFQFVSEAIVLTTLGGGIGVGVGWGLAQIVTEYAQMQTVVTAFSVMISLSVAVLTGLVFGTYPAWKAASLDPVDALKSS
jgi:putative ABC transport system permease protein